MRLDAYLVEKGIVKSRERAKEHIKNGEVNVNGKVVYKPSYDVLEEYKVVFCGEKLRYVGRGGLKLEKALDRFGIDVRGKHCIDIGASTGGFTDCLLRNGAAHVYAVDVGHGQLDRSLAEDPRVTNMEGVNINDVSREDFPDCPEFISADVSFVSLKKILPSIVLLLNGRGEAAVLIKPQFEAGKSNIGKNGIVKDRKIHVSVIKDICAFCLNSGFEVKGLDFSPVSGGDGNIEYLAHIVPSEISVNREDFDIKNLVDRAFSKLK